MIEEDTTICPYCGLTVSYKWEDGFIVEQHNVLIANSVFHAKCWADIEKEMPAQPSGNNPKHVNDA